MTKVIDWLKNHPMEAVMVAVVIAVFTFGAWIGHVF